MVSSPFCALSVAKGMVISMNKSIIYWKWDDSTINADLIYKIEDLCKRTEMSAVFVALHWVKLSIFDKKLISAIKICADELHKRDRKLYLEICPRNEGEAFFKQSHSDFAYLTNSTEIHLDGNGKGYAEVDVSELPHYWRVNASAKVKMLAAFIFEKDNEFSYIPETKKSAMQYVSFAIKNSPENRRVASINVDCGIENSEKFVSVFIGNPQSITELASADFKPFFQKMLDSFNGIQIDGVCSDEWGYDVIINIDDIGGDDDYYKKKRMYLNHLTYSSNFSDAYQEECGGDLSSDLLDMFYCQNNNYDLSIAKINNYHKVLRKIMKQNDEDMYELSKKTFGADTFFGVHPTWWGNDVSQNFEGFKNGFYWWEAKRDIAQTDEIVIMPIRTALAHKCKSPIWYNMWYSMGTRDINTYFSETYNNARYGGRTHYLAYECPNETVVLELKPTGMLERIEEMDKIVRQLDEKQTAQPDCRVLMLFGMENVLNWRFNEDLNSPWYPAHSVQKDVLRCADEVFKKFLCDLVPTTEIVNKSLSIKNGMPVYGTQQYDAVILFAPNSMDKRCFDFVEKIDSSKLIVCGTAQIYQDATKLSEHDKMLLQGGVNFEEILCSGKLIEQLERFEIKKNCFENGCILQDGSMIFTAEGKLPSKNPLIIDIEQEGLHVKFKGEDLLFLEKSNSEYIPVFQKGEIELEYCPSIE